MSCEESRTVLFLADELDGGDRAEFDEHLLECEACWAAVSEDRRGRAFAELLREPAPAGLADRIRLGAETRRPPAVVPVGDAPPTSERRGARRAFLTRRRLAAAAAVFVLAAGAGAGAGLALTAGPTAPPAAAGPSMAATMAAVHLGHGLPMHVAGPAVGVPTRLGQPVSMTVGGVDLSVTYYRVDGGEALVVHSERPFAMPSSGSAGRAAGTWTAQLEGLTIWCANGKQPAAIVTPMAGQATDLAQYLHMSA